MCKSQCHHKSGSDSYADNLLSVTTMLYAQLHKLHSTLHLQSLRAPHQSLPEQSERQQEPQQHFVTNRFSIRLSSSHLPSAAVGMTSCSAEAYKLHNVQDTSV